MRRDPEVIVREYYYETGSAYQVDDPTRFKEAKDEIMGRAELANVSAIPNERVYIMDWTLIESTRHFIGIQYMAKWLYPEKFVDLDPKATHQEYITRFLRLDYDLDEHGVWVYPETS
jgi:iron complex transport system substrate-binding protein